MNLIEKICIDLEIPSVLIDEIFSLGRKRVKHLKIPKKSGGQRTVIQPSKKVKMVQYWLINNVFKKMPVHPAASAYFRGASIKYNAERHAKKRYFLKLDLSDFFWSISYHDLERYLVPWHNQESPGWSLDNRSRELIRWACFYHNDFMPIGYPSSPVISNIVMYQFDSDVWNKLEKDKTILGNVIYSRYADDMVFSADRKGACKNIEIMVSSLIDKSISPKLSLNHNKTCYASASGGSAIVTGMRLCHDGHMTVHRKTKQETRFLLSQLKKGVLPSGDKGKIIGYLSYLQDVDPAFYTKIQTTFFAEISAITK